jgi:hypothetical protein
VSVLGRSKKVFSFHQQKVTVKPRNYGLMNRWYLSFATDEEGFLGACVVEADEFDDALRKSHILAINPGGEVMGMLVPNDARDNLPLNKLMSKAELASYGPIKRMGDMDKPPQRIGLN